MLDEIIVCSKCKGEDCRVEELKETKKITMEEVARRGRFPQDAFQKVADYWGRSKTFIVTCQDCGYQIEFHETINNPQPMWSAK